VLNAFGFGVFMKKTILLIAGLFALICAGQAWAEVSAPVSSAAHPAKTAKHASRSHNRMKSCAAQYRIKNIPKSGYHAFMSQCLRTHPAKTAPTSPTTAKQ